MRLIYRRNSFEIKLTVENIKNSVLDWSIGRNGICLEPNIEYKETYMKEGVIRNCAGDGTCTFISCKELVLPMEKC